MSTLRRHRTLLFTLPATILLAALVMWADLTADHAAQAAARTDRQQAQVMLGGLIKQYLNFTELEVAHTAAETDWSMRVGDPDDHAVMNVWINSSPMKFVGATLTDLNGRELGEVGRVSSSTDDPGFAPWRTDLLAGRPGLSGLLHTPGGPLVAVTVPVGNDGAPTGLLTAFADPRTWPLQGYAAQLDLGRNATAAVLDGAGIVVASVDADQIGTPLVATRPASLGLHQDGDTVLSTAPVGTDGWVSATVQPAADFYGVLGHARRWLVAALTALLVVLVGGLMVADARRRAALSRLADEAIFDPLTGVATRRLLDLRLAAALSRRRARHSHVAVLFCDLDRFKPVNDQLGHAAGDLVLRTVAQRMQAQCREEDFLARIGGDEFVVLVEDVDDRGQVTDIARRLIAAVGEPFQVHGQTVQVGVSVGVAVLGENPAESAVLLAAADAAMYRAKSSGSGVDVVHLDDATLSEAQGRATS